MPWPTAGLRGHCIAERNNSVCFSFRKQSQCLKRRERDYPSQVIALHHSDETSEMNSVRNRIDHFSSGFVPWAPLLLELWWEQMAEAAHLVVEENQRRTERSQDSNTPSGPILQECTMTATLPSAFWEFCA